MVSTSATESLPRSFSLMALGFRPFYLSAAIFAVLALPVWLAQHAGVLRFTGYLGGVTWHSHEMVFGFTSAVIAGFLLTAVRNWTSLPTPTGLPLAILVALWWLARVLLVTDATLTAVVTDLVFLPALGVTLAIPIWRSRNFRNLKLLVVLAGLTAANALYHGALLGVFPTSWTGVSTTLALDLITILMAIIGGRVIPVFTANAIPAAHPIRHRAVEVVSVGALLIVLVLGVIQAWHRIPEIVWVSVLGIAAVAHTIRWLLWKPHRTLGNALLWMLPMAYAWIPVTLSIRAFSMLQAIPPGAAVHALTLGAISSLMMAMMMRSALGHTGRPLKAGVSELVAFICIQLAAIVRVAGVFAMPEFYLNSLIVSGVLWTTGFAVFLIRYVPMLVRARVDGRPG